MKKIEKCSNCRFFRAGECHRAPPVRLPRKFAANASSGNRVRVEALSWGGVAEGAYERLVRQLVSAVGAPMSNLPPGAVQIAPLPEFDGCTKLVNRHAGSEPLAVRETTPGVYLSVWIVNKKAMQKLKQRGGIITLAIDTNVPGHPTVSMVARNAELT